MTENKNLAPLFTKDDWQTWTPRVELSPIFDKVVLGEEICLRIATNGKFQSYGSWCCEIGDIQEHAAYSFSFEYLAEEIVSESVSISIIITWIGLDGIWINRGYIDGLSEGDNGWNKLSQQLVAPTGSDKIKIELEFRWSASGSVTWRKPELIITEQPKSRKVKLATTYYMPERGTTEALANNVKQILLRIDRAGRAGVDLICISEAQCSRCTDLNDLFRDPPETIPGQLTAMMAAKAKEYNTYIVFNLDERDGECVYNTSILLGRDGCIVGKYRKVHLPMAEAQLGFTPGHEYPVFETDFGKVGLMICWDQTFPEAARIMRLQGAEILCISTAGDSLNQTVARAVDNGVYLVVAGTNGARPSRVINPIGEILSEFGPENETGISCTEVDLNQRFYKYWESVGPALGEMRSLYVKERRPDTYQAIEG